MVSENNFVLTRACSDVKQKHDIVQRKNQLKTYAHVFITNSTLLSSSPYSS